MVAIISFIVFSCVLTAMQSFQPLQSIKLSTRSSISMHFVEAINGNTNLASESLKLDRYLATNRFKVRPNQEAKFEKRWTERKSRLAKLDGFRFFSLFRKIELPGMPSSLAADDKDKFNYISFTIWENKENFDAWRTGEAFKEAHGGGSILDFMKLIGTALFIIDGSPKPAFYDALLVQANPDSNMISAYTSNEEGWRNIPADGVNMLTPEIFMTQNRFKVLSGKEIDFEKQWLIRDSHLLGVPGFMAFSMLRRDASVADDGYNYIATTIWQNQQAFQNWRTSDAFKASHASSPATAPAVKCYEESPKLAFYEGKLTLINDRGILDFSVVGGGNKSVKANASSSTATAYVNQ